MKNAATISNFYDKLAKLDTLVKFAFMYEERNPEERAFTLNLVKKAFDVVFSDIAVNYHKTMTVSQKLQLASTHLKAKELGIV